MVKVKFNGKEWDVVDESDKDENVVYLDGQLKTRLDNIKKILKKGWDCVIVIDGKERSGKSVLGMTCLWYLLDCKVTPENICSGNIKEAAEKVASLPDKSGLLLDESSLAFNSKDAMKRESVWLTKIMDVVGQKNMVFILCLPSFFDLNKQLACRRSRFLLHVYTDEQLQRGRFAYFGEHTKHILFEIGKKNFGSYDKPQADFIGTFSDWHAPFYDEYLLIKKKSLADALKDPAKKGNVRWARERDILIKYILENTDVTQNRLKDMGINITQARVSQIVNKEEDE